jgi:hypothetical protein
MCEPLKKVSGEIRRTGYGLTTGGKKDILSKSSPRLSKHLGDVVFCKLLHETLLCRYQLIGKS